MAKAEQDVFMLDTVARFLIHIDREEAHDEERFMFTVEEAHWFYNDFYAEQKKAPVRNFKKFVTDVFAILNHDANSAADAIKNFDEYKKQIPVGGCIILNPTLDKILMVRGFGPKGRYNFPKGKVSKDEKLSECAVREVREEIGFDVSEKIIRNITITHKTPIGVSVSLWFVLNMSETTKFKTETRNEISDIRWIKIGEMLNRREVYTPFLNIEGEMRKHLKKFRSLFAFERAKILALL